MGRAWHQTILVLAALIGGGQPVDRPSVPPISVRIVPSAHSGKGGRAVELYKTSPHLYVVITNTSASTVRLWEEWCSWGYYNLSFVLTEQDGKAVEVRKKLRGFRGNFPSEFVIPPGDVMVIPVTFDAKVWEGFPSPEWGKPRVVKMKAVYRSRSEKRVEEHGVWTGEATSPEEAYTVHGPHG